MFSPSHIELLVNHHSMPNALVVINNMLKNLKYLMFIHVAADHAARAVGATALMEEYMDASNFGVSVWSASRNFFIYVVQWSLCYYSVSTFASSLFRRSKFNCVLFFIWRSCGTLTL